MTGGELIDLLRCIDRTDNGEAPHRQLCDWIERRCCHVLKVPHGDLRGSEIASDVAYQLFSCPKNSRKNRRRVGAARSPLFYLDGMIRRAIINAYRPVRKRRKLEVPLDNFQDLEAKAVTPHDETVMCAELIRSIWPRLKRVEQELLILRFWDGLEIKKIAQWYGIKYQTASRRLRRLLAKLRRLLDEEKPSVGRQAARSRLARKCDQEGLLV